MNSGFFRALQSSPRSSRIYVNPELGSRAGRCLTSCPSGVNGSRSASFKRLIISVSVTPTDLRWRWLVLGRQCQREHEICSGFVASLFAAPDAACWLCSWSSRLIPVAQVRNGGVAERRARNGEWAAGVQRWRSRYPIIVHRVHKDHRDHNIRSAYRCCCHWDRRLPGSNSESDGWRH